MALTSPSSATGTGSKTIAIVHYNGTSLGNTVIYTVPAGKKFVGVLLTNNANSGFGRINSVTDNIFFSASANVEGTGQLNVTLQAGDVFKSGTTNYAYHSIIGVESDA